MSRLAALTLGAVILPASWAAQALVCSIPGTTLAWATDQCLLETGETDSSSKEMRECLSSLTTIRQPCEWNETYKKKYCETLIGKEMLHGSVSQCLSDPTIIGPTVRDLLREPLGRFNDAFKPAPHTGVV